jgi:adenine-specific DNA-methyltransferase
MEQENIEQINLDHINWKSSEEFFNSLRDELDKLDDKDESYNFTWVGKRKSIIEAGAPINKTLRPDIDASKDFDNTKNMLIVGDNLDALKLLQESYLGKIKMIYIDPPYNTGHDFVYHDNFTVKKSDYEDNTTDSEGNKIISEDEFTENSKSNGRFHSDWLSMVYPRLKLARNLLTDNGVIFISIDDNEQANLKKLCDEVFFDENVDIMIWRKSGVGRDGKMKNTTTFRKDHEYIAVCFRNNQILNKIKEKPNFTNEYTNPDNDPRGPWLSGSLSRSDVASNPNHRNYYEVTSPSGVKIKRQFEVSRDEFLKLDADKRISWGKGGNSVPRLKIFINEEREITPYSLLLDKGTTTDGTKEVSEILGIDAAEIRPKPELLIRTLSQIGTSEGSIILDFFAGSGTTGHAVMDLNAEDGGNRKYILVQLDEPTDDKSEAKKAGYDTIDQITAERLRRAGDKIIKEHPDLEGKLDTGFRVFHIDSANEREDIRKSVYDTKQEDMFDSIDNIKHDRTPLDLLFGTIIYMALPLDLKLEVKNINNNTIYFYGYQDEGMGLIACFDDSINDDTVKEIAKLKPLTAVFKDSSFKDSAAKINLSEIFRTISNETRVKVI